MLTNEAAVGTHGIKLQRIAIHLSAVTWSTMSHISQLVTSLNNKMLLLVVYGNSKKVSRKYDNLLCFNLLSNTSVVVFFK